MSISPYSRHFTARPEPLAFSLFAIGASHEAFPPLTGRMASAVRSFWANKGVA